MRMHKKKHATEEVSIDELLDDLTNQEPEIESRPAQDPWSEEYLTNLHKKEARKTLDKYRRDEPIAVKKVSQRKDPPIVSEKVSQVRKCQNCYYCTGTRKVGGSWWCHCTNPGRSAECEKQTESWVKSKLNLSCWRLPD